MQNAKDSFYEVLRARLASLNPDRTIVVRGVTRPGVLVDENEARSVDGLPDCFHLSWDEVVSIVDGPMPLLSMRCVFRYETAGATWNGGLDRGRALSAMDAELMLAVGNSPQRSTKMDYTPLQRGGAATPMGTAIWWSDLLFGEQQHADDRLTRMAYVQVMSLQEAGEL